MTVNISLKSGRGSDAPWVTIEAPDIASAEAQVQAFLGSNLAGSVAAAQQVFQTVFEDGAANPPAQQAPTPAQAVQNVTNALGGEVVGTYPQGAPQQPQQGYAATPPQQPVSATPGPAQQYAPPAQAAYGQSAPPTTAPAGAPGVQVEEGRWGDVYVIGHPQAPYTPYGAAVLKRAKSKAGNFYLQWIDPRSKAIPSVYQSGVRQDPADKWEAQFADRGTDTSMIS